METVLLSGWALKLFYLKTKNCSEFISNLLLFHSLFQDRMEVV